MYFKLFLVLEEGVAEGAQVTCCGGQHQALTSTLQEQSQGHDAIIKGLKLTFRKKIFKKTIPR